MQARELDVVKANEMLSAHLAWEAEMKPAEITQVSHFINTGNMRCATCDAVHPGE